MVRSTSKPRARSGAKKPKFTARTADRHVLYQLAVQAPEREVRFLSRYHEKVTGQPLRRLREDFCGTALMASWFVKIHPENRAEGVDLHQPTLDWGMKHNVDTLLDAEQKKRLRLHCSDVLTARTGSVQTIAALNFSYSVFKSRWLLSRYFAACFRALEPGGLLFVDGWGGPDVQEPRTDRTRHQGFDYLWEQRTFDPISHEIFCAIHFEFRDGTRMKDAFVYDWRLWTMPELRELMEENGFEDVHVLWEGSDSNGRGNGAFRRKERGDADPAWIVYVVGRKPGGPRVRRR